jgi:hypothetical protein
MSLRHPLVLTGPPAVGKSTAARALALARPQSAVVEVDDLRQLVLTGAAAPWQGEAGARQQLLGARNACALAANFLAADVEVVITDLVTSDTAALYRELLPGCLIVRLSAPLSETQRRSASRTRWLTSAEFVALHDHDSAHPPAADVTIDVTHYDVIQQTAAIERSWASAGVG